MALREVTFSFLFLSFVLVLTLCYGVALRPEPPKTLVDKLSQRVMDSVEKDNSDQSALAALPILLEVEKYQRQNVKSVELPQRKDKNMRPLCPKQRHSNLCLQNMWSSVLGSLFV
eukprot:217657-Amphidinium_carterae.4